MSLEGSIHYRMRIQHVEAAVPNTVWVACNEDYSVTEVSRHPKVSSSCASSLDHMWAVRRWWTGLDLETYSLPNTLDNVSQTYLVRGMLKCLFSSDVCLSYDPGCLVALMP
jgi:hypothetical protein